MCLLNFLVAYSFYVLWQTVEVKEWVIFTEGYAQVSVLHWTIMVVHQIWICKGSLHTTFES